MCVSEVVLEVVITSLLTGILSLTVFLILYLLSFMKRFKSHYVRTAFLSFLVIAGVLIIFSFVYYSLFFGKFC
ncbi:MAG: hypothetical protein AABX66_04170 [Nanoarchaeota archaeon]